MRLIDADVLTKNVTKWLNADPNADRMVNIDDIAPLFSWRLKSSRQSHCGYL